LHGVSDATFSQVITSSTPALGVDFLRQTSGFRHVCPACLWAHFELTLNSETDLIVVLDVRIG
jgi:hypothetical protein